jgi:choice-of-anchor C domain-containing protein
MLLAMSALAHGAAFTNGSFESGTNPGSYTELSAGSAAITGWSVGGNGVDYIGTYWQAQDGDRSIDLSRHDAGSIWQAFDTIMGATYRVSFWMAGNPDGAPTVKSLMASAAGDSATYFFDFTGHTHAAMGWESREFLFTATSTTTTLTFTSLTPTFFGPALDNVSVSQVVPEPGTWMFLGGGLTALVLRRWKSARRA